MRGARSAGTTAAGFGVWDRDARLFLLIGSSPSQVRGEWAGSGRCSQHRAGASSESSYSSSCVTGTPRALASRFNTARE
jgi:hypothetical protein